MEDVVDFFIPKCQMLGITAEMFGICDDDDKAEKTPAYVCLENEEKWGAIIKNHSGKPLNFTAVDNCVVVRRDNDDMDVLKLRPGITGPATLKYRLEDEMISGFMKDFRNMNYHELTTNYPQIKISDKEYAELIVKSDQEVAVWYNDNVIYPDKVRLNCHYYRHYSFWKDIEMIFATVLGFKVKFAGEEV